MYLLQTSLNRLTYLRVTVVIACLVGIALSHRQWVGQSRTIPETRVYKGLKRHLCSYLEDPREAELVVKETPAILTGNYIVKRIGCLSLMSE